MNGNTTPILKLYPNVIPVKGYNRSLLMDLQKGVPHLVPNALLEYLETGFRGEKSGEYEEFILRNELGLFVDSELGTSLTPLPTDYYPDSSISNAILELDGQTSWNVQAVLEQLDALGAQFLEVRFLDAASLRNHFDVLRKCLEYSGIEFLQILVPFHEDLKAFLDARLNDRFFRLSDIVVYRASSGFELEMDGYNLLFTKQESVSHEYCGNVSADYFVVNTQAYIRNRNYNSCLAHKISVDKDGFICNCPSGKVTYGHVDSTSLHDALLRESFREQWSMTKDRVLVCSVCEFRWICSDCRAFTVKELKAGKPSGCHYNPFISLWKGDPGYLPEDQCGVVFNKESMEVDHTFIMQLNQNLWQ